MSDLPAGRLVFAVAQLPFDTSNQETQNVNTFGTLVPVLNENGRPARRDDYPQAGLVWWMLRAGARAFAEPGRLVSGRLEYAVRYDSRDPESHLFQVEFESVEPVRSNTGTEVLTVTSTRVKTARDLVNVNGVVELDHPPSDYVMVRWHDNVYGPLRTTFERRADGVYAVSLSAQSGDREVMRVPASVLITLREGHLSHASVDVSLENRPPHNATRIQRCHYEIITAAGLDALASGRYDAVPLLRDDEILKRVAKPLLQRKERQQLGQLLDKVSGDLQSSGDIETDVIDLIARTQEQLRRGEDLAGELASALIKSGLIDESIQARVREEAEAHVESNVATLRAQIAERTREVQEPLERLRGEREQLEQSLQRERRDAKVSLEADLRAMRQQHEESIRDERGALETQRRDLEQQRELVIGQLDEVRRRYEQSRGEVLQDFLAMLPLLERVLPSSAMGGSAMSTPRAISSAAPSANSASAGQPEEGSPIDVLTVPNFVVADDGDTRTAISELELLDRFRSHVRTTGFEYRDLDLVSFHLSVKTGDLTILGGVSGTGKSTLPHLYAAALAGDAPTDDVTEGRYLHVGVRPSWLDQQDLLGHVNTIDGRFVPSDSGLYEFVIWAQREFERKQAESGVYVVCLDEMNLSHVEHYFSGFLQALERPEGLRTVRCFDQRSVSGDDPFRRYSQLNLPRSLRFVGTVNYDETTKPLSLRLLDRANVLQLQTTNLRGVDIGATSSPVRRTSGPMIHWQQMRAWTRDEELERPLAEFLDRLRAPLASLHTPLTPRRDRAIRRFVASAADVVESRWIAFDLQLVQRVLPQIRAVFGPEARHGLEDLVRIIHDHAADLPETQRVLAVLAERELGGIDV